MTSEVEWVGRVVDWNGARCALWIEKPSNKVIAFASVYDWDHEPLLRAIKGQLAHLDGDEVLTHLRVAPEDATRGLASWLAPLVVAPTDDVDLFVRQNPGVLYGGPSEHWYLRGEPDPYAALPNELVSELFAASAEIHAANPWRVVAGEPFQIDVPTLDAIAWCGQLRRHYRVAPSIVMAPAYSEMAAVRQELVDALNLTVNRELPLRLVAIEFLRQSDAPRALVAHAQRDRLNVDQGMYPFALAIRTGRRVDHVTPRDAELLQVLLACARALHARCPKWPGDGIGVFSVTAGNGHVATVRYPHPESPRLPADTMPDF